MKRTKRKFDCVAMMHRGGDLLRQSTAGMTLEEELAYWRNRTEEMCERQQAGREEQKVGTSG